MSTYYYFALMVTCLMACKTTPFIPGQSKVDYIRFGNGGGFTGAVQVFYLTEKGVLYKQAGDKLEKLYVAQPEITRQMFLTPELIQAKKNPYHLPGNRYFFIEYHIGESSQSITWGGDQNHLKAYETWYKNLMYLVKTANLNTQNIVE